MNKPLLLGIEFGSALIFSLIINALVKPPRPWIGALMVGIWGAPGFLYYRWEFAILVQLLVVAIVFMAGEESARDLPRFVRLGFLSAFSVFAYWDIRTGVSRESRVRFMSGVFKGLAIALAFLVWGSWVSLINLALATIAPAFVSRILASIIGLISFPLSPLGPIVYAMFFSRYADLACLVGTAVFSLLSVGVLKLAAESAHLEELPLDAATAKPLSRPKRKRKTSGAP